EATVYYENFHYQHEDDAVERLTRLLMADAPPSIEKFRLVSVRGSVPQQEFHILRTPAERAMGEDQDNPSVFNSPVTIQAAALDNPILETQRRSHYPHFDWDIFPQFRQQFFDPNNPLGVQMVGALMASVELKPGLTIFGEGEVNLFDTFNTARQSNSVLPHVRTDFVRYFTEGKNGVGALEANYRTRLTPEFYATLKAGYLESMFAGAGGEVLYRPDGARWAIGADMYEVWQRNYDRLFGLQNYHVATGHVTLYWDSPFYDLNFQVRAGQYLAGDRGLTLQITRRFSTGIEIGAFVTKTNVSSHDFGEGSFDKGIVIRIPLGWVAPIDTQSLIAMDLRPVQRDGGQALLGDATLYDETRRASESEFVRNGKSFADDW
ncbi:MAG TPA: YjbH domain-containing protein, partial [Candidatus Saccharimonadales bacterium]|nr:YjbH domain-containing protein [Candidatus Saccharimonadales bacterium]